MIFRSYNTIPILSGGFLFAFASKCIPTFFSVFLADKGYSTVDVILISTIFFVGSLFVSNDFIKENASSKVFQIAAAVGSIILHLQQHIYFVAGWFAIRLVQGVLDVLCRNSLNNLVPDRYTSTLNFYMNIGSSMGFLLMCFPEMFNILFTITGVVLNLSLISIALQKDNVEYNKVIYIKKEKALNSWYDILRTNSVLFIAMIFSTFLTATLNTILPITLRNNLFVNSSILQIMLVGSIGNALCQMTGSYLRNIFGTIKFLRILLISLLLLYVGGIVTIYYQSMLVSVFIFFISGFHNVIQGTVSAIFREEEGATHRLTRHGVNQIIQIGSIISSMIALIFLTFSKCYGLFIFWFLSIACIWFIIKAFKFSYGPSKGKNITSLI